MRGLPVLSVTVLLAGIAAYVGSNSNFIARHAGSGAADFCQNITSETAIAVRGSADAASRIIGMKIDDLRSAGTALNGKLRLAENFSVAEGLRDRPSILAKDDEVPTERYRLAMIRLDGAANKIGRYLHAASNDVVAFVMGSPDNIPSSASSPKVALDQHGPVVRLSVAERKFDYSHKSARANRNEEYKVALSLPPYAPDSAFQPEPRPDQPSELSCSLGNPDFLAMTGCAPEERRRDAQAKMERDFQQGALHIAETQLALSMDLERALKNAPPPKVGRRSTQAMVPRRTTSLAWSKNPKFMTEPWGPTIKASMLHVLTGQPVKAPSGYTDFCLSKPKECEKTAYLPRKVTLTLARWSELNEVNNYVNRSIPQVEDIDNYGTVEHWSYPNSRGGDCEDLVLLKRKMLMDRGWPAEALLITLVRQWNGDGHAILTAVTDKGDYVLDNKNWAVLLWVNSPYTWVKRQSPQNPTVWVSLQPSTIQVAANKITSSLATHN